MKVFITGGCATRAYVEFFQKCFPDWETRASVLAQATEWIEDGKPEFLEYIENVDVFVGLTDRAPIKDYVNPDALNIYIPSFDYFGFHSDSVFIIGVTSPLDLGVIHSRIVASCYALGKSESHAMSRFNSEVFEKLGYLDSVESERNRIIGRFDSYGIDIRNHFDRWIENGNFLYTVNHPETNVFFDIASASVEKYFPGELSETAREKARESTNNYMADGLIWPVYPELADHFGLAKSEYVWRTSQIRKEPEYLDLKQFVERSYKQFSNVGGIPDSGIEKIGGLEEIEKLAA